MGIHDWEFFESEVVSAQFQITDYGPLIGPINSFTVARNEKRQLVLTTRSSTSTVPQKTQPPVNSVTIDSEKVHFTHRYGKAAAVAQGLSFRSLTTKLQHTDALGTQTENFETSQIQSLSWS